MKNISIAFLNIEELEEEVFLDKALQDSPSLLIQVFCANAKLEKIKKLQTFFKKHYPLSVVMGTTTDGIIDGTSVYTQTKSLVNFSLFEKTSLVQTIQEHSSNYNSSYKTGMKIAEALCTKSTKLLLTFTDGIFTNGEEYLNGISSIASKQLVAGGMAADNGKLEKTFVFNKEKILSNGAIAVALNSDVLSITSSYAFDWMPIRKKLKVTKSINNRVYEIDGMSAVDVYAKYMGKELVKQLPQIGIEFPLIFQEDGVNVGRAVISKHDDGSLTFAGNIKEGSYAQFGVGNIDTILRGGYYQIDKMYNDITYENEAVFVYSCMARRRFLGSYVENELNQLEGLGTVCGFFTYGEFFHSQNSNQLLNETMTMITLSESNKISSPHMIKEQKIDYIIDSEHVISHLANVVSNELAELNDNLEKRIQESSEYIYKQAYFDKLTELPNRLSLIKHLESSVGKVLFLINIDDFTMINDFYGHAIGDQVLVHLAKVLSSLMKKHNAQTYKLPSDEYAIIIDIEHNKETIELEIKNILSCIDNEDFIFNGNFAHISVTISAAFINKDKTGLINADMALKSAKKLGKDFMVFKQDLMLAQQYEKNILMANIIRGAIANDKILPYFQAIYDAKTLEIEKYEALVRLKNKDEILSPYFFLDISQKIKLYPHITEIMLEKTFSFFRKNGKNFSVNLAFSDIVDSKTRDMIFEKIVHHSIAKQLTIEILESQEIEDEDIMYKFINKVYALGAKIAIDDFGSGFANFEYMTKIRSDYMKIDGSLIKNIDKDENARLVVETIVIFAQKLGKKTIAEFVHSKEVYDVVREIGIDYLQGYYLAEPSASLR